MDVDWFEGPALQVFLPYLHFCQLGYGGWQLHNLVALQHQSLRRVSGENEEQ